MSDEFMHMTVKAMRQALDIKIDSSQPEKKLVCGLDWHGHSAINTIRFGFDDGGYFHQYRHSYEKVTCSECIKVLKSKGL